MVIDRIILEKDTRTRLADSIEMALRWGNGRIIVLYNVPGLSGKIAIFRSGRKLYSTLPLNPDTCQIYARGLSHDISLQLPSRSLPRLHGARQKAGFFS